MTHKCSKSRISSIPRRMVGKSEKLNNSTKSRNVGISALLVFIKFYFGSQLHTLLLTTMTANNSLKH